MNIQKICYQNQPSGFFKVWTFFKCFDRDLRELKQKNKLDTDQLFYYILNIQKMCHQNQPSNFFKVWTFFKCFDRDLWEMKQNYKFDTAQLFYYILNTQKCVVKASQVVSLRKEELILSVNQQGLLVLIVLTKIDIIWAVL